MKIGVRSNLARVRRDHRRFHADQVPFATSKAINELAKSFQRQQTGHMEQEFTVRNRLFVSRAVKIKPFATKRSLKATVQIEPPGGPRTADILAKFEGGGTKKPRGSRLAVPQQVRRTKTGKVSTSLRPSNLQLTTVTSTVSKGAKRTFSIRLPGGRGGIYQRVGRGRRGKVRLLYSFIPRARIKPVLGFFRRARMVARREFDGIFDRVYRLAVESRK